jgi:hypothetical protein
MIASSPLKNINMQMKNKSMMKSLFAGFAILALATGLTSCKKNDVDLTGSANLKVVNASPGSSPQGFYLSNSTVVKGNLAYGDESDYIVTNSGNNLEAQFKTEASATPYATGSFSFDSGKNYSIFLAGQGQSARIKVYTDDMAASASGQAKVRFINLSDALSANIDIKKGSGENLAVNLAGDNASAYVNLAPGVLNLNIFITGQTTSLGSFNLKAFLPGKIYTVYVTGSTSTNIEVHQILHN